MKKAILSAFCLSITLMANAGNNTTETTTVRGKNNGSTVSFPPGGGTVVSVNCDNAYPWECYSITTSTSSSQAQQSVEVNIFNEEGVPIEKYTGQTLDAQTEKVDGNNTIHTLKIK